MTEPTPYRSRMSIAQALDRSLEHTKQMLFRPFNFEVWLAIGLMVFLELLVQGSGQVPVPNFGGYNNFQAAQNQQEDSDDPVGEFTRFVRQAVDWTKEHIGEVLGMVVGLAVVGLALFVLFTWLGCRGQMMLVRAVATTDTRVGENWRAVANLAWSLFKFRAVLWLVGILMWLGMAAWAVASVVKVGGGEPESFSDYLFPLIPIAITLALFSVPYVLIHVLLRCFVVPLMYRFNLPVLDAWREFGVVARDNVLTIALFLLMRLVYFMMYNIASMLVGCFTCCVGALPVINQAIFAPFHVFDRALSMFLIGSMGPDYEMVYTPPAPPSPVFPTAPLLDIPGQTPPPPPPPPMPPQRSGEGGGWERN